MKNKKVLISVICIAVVLVLGITTTILILNKKSNIDLNKLSSFEYYSGSSSVSKKFTGMRNESSIDMEFTTFDSGNQKSYEITIFTDDFIELLRTTKIEDCKKHTYDYQCGENDGCAYSSFSVNFDNEEKVCYQINSKIIEYFNSHYEMSIESEEESVSGVDWSSMEFSINDKEYKSPTKVSNFINNGWQSYSAEYEELINNSISYSISKGYNFIIIKQNELKMTIYFDTANTNINVLEADIVRFELENIDNNTSSNFNFYGVNFNTQKEQITKIFGTKNYSETEDEKYNSFSYSKTTEDGKHLILNIDFDKETNKLAKLSISLY